MPPDGKCLSSKRVEDAARQEVTLDVEDVLDGGVDRQETLGWPSRLEPPLLSFASPKVLV